MSFNNINLPDLLLADLYKEGLVVIDSEIKSLKINNEEKTGKDAAEMILVNKTVAKTPDSNTKSTLAFLGDNRKHVAIIVQDESAIHLQDELLDILSAILNACKLNLADVAIVNIQGQKVDDGLLRQYLNPSSVLLFGVETNAIGLPFSIPDHKIQQFNNCSYLQAASLEKMKGNSTEAKLEKSRLWVCLKNLFGI